MGSEAGIAARVAMDEPAQPGVTASLPDPAFDPNVVTEMWGLLGEETVREVIDAFLRDTEDLVAVLHESLSNGATGDLAARLHRMVGSAAAVGANRLAGMCRTSENALAVSQLTASTSSEIAAIGRALEDTRAVLPALIHRLATSTDQAT